MSKTRDDITECRIRPAIKGDAPYIMAIEWRSFGSRGWNMDEFLEKMTQPETYCHVAEAPGGAVVGFLVYDVFPTQIVIVDLAVNEDLRRRSIGFQMIHYLMILGSVGKRKLVAPVWDGNLDAHLFFKDMGFHAGEVQRDFYDSEPGSDAYIFKYCVEACHLASQPLSRS